MKMKLVDHHPAPCTVLGVLNADQPCVTAVRVLVVLRMMNLITILMLNEHHQLMMVVTIMI